MNYSRIQQRLIKKMATQLGITSDEAVEKWILQGLAAKYSDVMRPALGAE